jgi:hypothetical protein
MNSVLTEAWKSKIDVVESVRGGMTNEAREALAKVLNNTDSALKDLRAISRVKNESLVDGVPASQYSGIDWFPEHAIDMVSAIYASQIIDDIVSVQSIDSPLGVIRFLQYVYGQDRGAAKRNEVAIDQWGAMQGAANGKFVAREFIDSEELGKASTATSPSTALVEGFAQHLPVRVDADSHIDFKVDGTDKAFRVKKASKDAASFTVVALDANGYEQALPSGVTMAASVNPVSGALKLEQTAGTAQWAATDSIAVSYFQDLSEVPTDSMNLELRLRTEMVKAVPHKIRANFAFDASYALSKVHGINVEEALVNACTAEIRQERDNEVINLLMKQAGSTSTWDRQITSYISQHEHDMSFLSELFACASKINFDTKRGFGNWVVVGRIGLNIIKSAGSDHFKATGTALPNNGAFVVGELEGQIKVIYSPYVPEDSYLVGYKGSDMDAGFVVADFMPITKTELVVLDDFVGRQGLVSYYGTKMINPKMYVVGKILNGDKGIASR